MAEGHDAINIRVNMSNLGKNSRNARRDDRIDIIPSCRTVYGVYFFTLTGSYVQNGSAAR